MLLKNDASNRILRYPPATVRFGGSNSQRPIFTTESRFLPRHASLAAKITKTQRGFHFKCQRHLRNESFPTNGGYAFFPIFLCLLTSCLRSPSNICYSPANVFPFSRTDTATFLPSGRRLLIFVKDDFYLNPAIVVTTLTCHVKESCYCSFKCTDFGCSQQIQHRIVSSSEASFIFEKSPGCS